MKFVLTMISIDRTPKENYLHVTLQNFERAGGFDRVFSKHLLVFAGCPSDDYIYANRYLHNINVTPTRSRLLPCENAGHALMTGGMSAIRSGAEYVLFMEDDLDFCGDFLGSVSCWLDDHATCLSDPFQQYRLFAFGCAYPQIMSIVNSQAPQRTFSWEYPIAAFYGTQCFAIRPDDAISLGSYLRSNPPLSCRDNHPSPAEYDLAIADWMRAHHPTSSHHLASVPSFVQHIGRQSTLKTENLTFPSWPGREWSYGK